jgi:hypothetical protein
LGIVLIFLFGVLLPAVSLAAELATGMCAQVFFNPIPTVEHVVLAAWVPIFNLLAMLVWIFRVKKWRTPLLWIHGAAMGIALVYTVAFLPVMPLAIPAIIAYGMGFLPLAPFFSLMCGLGLRKRLIDLSIPAPAEAEKSLQDMSSWGGSCTATPTDSTPTDSGITSNNNATPAAKPPSMRRSLLIGGALGILLVLSLEVQPALTVVGARMASSESPEQADSGMELLREFGSEQILLQMCYRNNKPKDFLPFGGGPSMASEFFLAKVPPEKAQEVFFRLTGKPYSAIPPPRTGSRTAIMKK